MAGLRTGRAVLIAGPTASGKSALAMTLARKLDGTIINADSMQVYRDLRVLTARPSLEDEAEIPHRLYGHVDAAVNYSVGAYVADAAKVLADTCAARRTPIFVGGTGLYFKALTHGLSAVPDIPAEIRDSIRARLASDGPQALHADLALRDPAAAEKLSPRDRTRIVRALEVVVATGRPLAHWHRVQQSALLPPNSFVGIFLDVDRNALYRRIDARFDAMIDHGALVEVAAMRARELDPLLPAMKAHGVPALVRHIDGDISREAATEIGKADTRRYAKRQFTWFRHQLPEFQWIAPGDAFDALIAGAN